MAFNIAKPPCGLVGGEKGTVGCGVWGAEDQGEEALWALDFLLNENGMLGKPVGEHVTALQVTGLMKTNTVKARGTVWSFFGWGNTKGVKK